MDGSGGDGTFSHAPLDLAHDGYARRTVRAQSGSGGGSGCSTLGGHRGGSWASGRFCAWRSWQAAEEPLRRRSGRPLEQLFSGDRVTGLAVSDRGVPSLGRPETGIPEGDHREEGRRGGSNRRVTDRVCRTSNPASEVAPQSVPSSRPPLLPVIRSGGNRQGASTMAMGIETPARVRRQTSKMSLAAGRLSQSTSTRSKLCEFSF